MLDAALAGSSSLEATLAGVTDRLETVLGVHIIHTLHNNPKDGLRNAAGGAEKKLKYPFGWYRIQTMAYQPEGAGTPKNIGRFGSGWALTKSDGEGATNAVVFNNHYFPVILQGALTVEFLDTLEAYKFIQKAMIAFAVEMLSFTVNMPSTYWTVRILSDGNSYPFPTIDDLDQSPSDAGMIAIEIPLSIHTRIGFNLEQAKINNYGTVTTRTGIREES